MVAKFIKVIRSINNQDQGASGGGHAPANALDCGTSGGLPSKYSGSRGVRIAQTQGAVSTADMTRLDVDGQRDHGYSEAARQGLPPATEPKSRTSYEHGFRPKTQGKETGRERSPVVGHGPAGAPEQAARYSAPRSISIQNFIRKLFGWSRPPRVDAMSNAGATMEHRSTSPSRRDCELGAGRRGDPSAVKLAG